jgi:bacillithiol biosynthesis deacetylase BshB1
MTKLDVLAIGPHPDDVELSCGGTLALCARQGRRVGILHLSRGESGTRGTSEQRLAEAEQAAAALGAVELAFLDFGDGALRHGQPEEDALIEVLRTWRPELVLGPPRLDRHPDHARAHMLVAAAAFYSGLAARGNHALPVHRPAAVFSYMQHHSFEPSFVVDVTSVWGAKMAALAAYRSQLYQAPPPAAAPPGGGQGPGAGTASPGRGGDPAADAASPGDSGGHRPAGAVSHGGGSGSSPAEGAAAPGGRTGTEAASAATPDREPGEGRDRAGARAGHEGAALPATKVASREFRLAVEGRARHFGLLIGAELGEPFWSPLPLAVGDLLALLPGGLR